MDPPIAAPKSALRLLCHIFLLMFASPPLSYLHALIVRVSVHSSVYLPVRQSICMSICLANCSLVCLSVRLCVRLGMYLIPSLFSPISVLRVACLFATADVFLRWPACFPAPQELFNLHAYLCICMAARRAFSESFGASTQVFVTMGASVFVCLFVCPPVYVFLLLCTSICLHLYVCLALLVYV